VHFTLRILAFVQLFIAAFVAMVGSFADGGQWWDRLVLTGVHPVAAGLLVALVMRKSTSKKLAGFAVFFLSLNVAADVLLAVFIANGISKGDWWLPLVFAIIPLIALPYSLKTLRRA
jgi:hypothetical protein